MSLIISNALMKAYENSRCSPELEGESSEGICSDGEQSAQLSGTNTPLLYCAQDKTKAFSRRFQSGMTCKTLTESHGAGLLTWYLADSRVRTSAAQDAGKELPERGQACGSTWRGLLAKYDHDSHSWKTAPCSLLEDWTLFSGTWPRSGTMRNGCAYQALKLEPITSAIESGSLLPTPTCHNAKEGAYPAEYTRNTPTLATHVGGKIHPHFTEWMMGWPQWWTDLKPLGMVKFHAWQQMHSFS